MLVREILKSKALGGVFTLPPSATVADAVAFLSEKRVGAVVIAEDDGVPLGILSERDIVRELGKSGAECLTMSVTGMMTKKLVTCDPSDTSDAVREMMTAGRFRHVPVLEDGSMIGLVSIGDVVKSRIEELAMEKDALEGMIMGR